MSIVIPATLVAARQAELSAVESGYGARIQYAQCLVDNSGGILWFTDGVKMPELIEAEKTEYYKGLKAIGYSNASNAWRMVKKYALEYATQIGLVEKPEAEGGEGGGEAESSGDARHTRSFSLRVIEDVGGIFKAGRRLEKEGTLTEKEKQILFKKAEGAGIDLDEFEMVLDAKLFEKNKNKVQEIPVAAPKSDKFGDVKKCPSCGAIAESFSTNCGECGYEFRNIEANTSVKLLSSKLESIVIEYDKLSFTENNIFGKFTDNKEMQSERRNIEILERQREAIKNFPIPNTREDILELLYFILPKTKLGFTSDKNVNAWRYKFSEVINRAKIAFNNDKKTLDLILSYEKNIDNSFILKIVSQYTSLSKKAKITIVYIIVLIIFFIIHLFLK